MANTVDIDVVQVGPATSETLIRGHRVAVDRPEAKGGDDRGPMGGELLLAGLGGCFMSNLLAAIRARELRIEGVRTRVSATLGETPPRFVAIGLAVSAEGEDLGELGKLVVIAERACIVANTLRGGVEVSISAIDK